MEKVNLDDFVKAEIYRLELKQKLELASLKSQLHTTFEQLKPLNLLKQTFTEVSESPEIKSQLLNSGIGLLTGYLSKKLMIGNTSNPIKNILGTIVEFIIANVVAKYSESILENGENILQLFLGKVKDVPNSSSAN
ncbi:MAG: hypothetical protein ACOVOW_03810 [Spirosomataceae bacterium]|jgi:hypothetical protein